MDKQLKAHYDRKLSKIGEVMVKYLKDGFNAAKGYPGGRTVESIHYKVEDGVVKVYGSPIVKWVDKGTDPYVIRAKPGKSLAFKANGKVVRKDGTVIPDGEMIFTKKVNHPGIEARAFIEVATFMAKKEILKSLGEKLGSPTLAFVGEGDE